MKIQEKYKNYILFDIQLKIIGVFLLIILGLVMIFLVFFAVKIYFTEPSYQSILAKQSTQIVLYKNYNLETESYNTSYIISNHEIIKQSGQDVKKYKISDNDYKRMKQILNKCDLKRFRSKIIFQQNYLYLVDNKIKYPLEIQYNIVDLETYIKQLINKKNKKS